MFPWHGDVSGVAGTHALPPATGLVKAAARPAPGAGIPVPALRSVGGPGGLGDLNGSPWPPVVFLAPRDGSAVRAVAACVAVRGGGPVWSLSSAMAVSKSSSESKAR